MMRQRFARTVTTPLWESACMTILLVGDVHYDLRQLDWVLAHASEHEVVVIAGDLLDIVSSVPLEVQVPVVLGYLERLAARTKAVVCSGNHDLTGRDSNGEKAALWMESAAAVGVSSDYSSIVLGNRLISVCPWWDGPFGREAVEAFLVEQAALVHGEWIWVYHWPPPDEPVSWTGAQFYGDPDLAGWIARFQPTLVLTGHVHQAPLADGGSWIARTGDSWVVNAGHEIGETPSHVVLDLDDASAWWWSIEGEARQSLVS